MVMVPPEQSADPRDYYNKHTKTDRLDSRILARLPLLHPDGLRSIDHLGPADPLLRAVRPWPSAITRLVVDEGRHHVSAICTLAAVMATRIAACWRRGENYVLRDVDGTEITEAEGRKICVQRYKVSAEVPLLPSTCGWRPAPEEASGPGQ